MSALDVAAPLLDVAAVGLLVWAVTTAVALRGSHDDDETNTEGHPK